MQHDITTSAGLRPALVVYGMFFVLVMFQQHIMINQFEAATYLSRKITTPDTPVFIAGDKDNIHQLMRRLLALTAKHVKGQNYQVVRQCFVAADALYDKGNAVVKNAVAHVFIGSFSTLLSLAREHRKEVLRLIPASLLQVSAAHKAVPDIR